MGQACPKPTLKISFGPFIEWPTLENGKPVAWVSVWRSLTTRLACMAAQFRRETLHLEVLLLSCACRRSPSRGLCWMSAQLQEQKMQERDSNSTLTDLAEACGSRTV